MGRQSKHRPKAPPASESESSDDEEAVMRQLDHTRGGWGGRKKTYYEDYEDEASDADSDENFDEEEEAEARRLRQLQFKTLVKDDADFDLHAGQEESDEEGEEEKEGEEEESEEEEEEEESEEASSDAEYQGAPQPPLASAAKGDQARVRARRADDGVRRVLKDPDALSKDQRIQLLMKDAPELMQLAREFRDHMRTIRNDLQVTAEGLSYLEVKHHLLLSYCTNIAFYMLLKAEGARVKDHPVIARLVEIRTVLEKMRPMDAKLKYQIDKLLKTAAAGPGAAAASAPAAKAKAKAKKSKTHGMDVTAGPGTDATRAPASAADPLSFRPRPDLMRSTRDGGLDAADDEHEGASEGSRSGSESAAEEEEEANDTEGQAPGPVGVYKPPRIAAMQYDGDVDAKADRRKSREHTHRRTQLAKSRLARDLEEEFGDRPLESHAGGGIMALDTAGAAAKAKAGRGGSFVDLDELGRQPAWLQGGDAHESDDEASRRQFEEDMFVRVTLTKDDKRRMAKRRRVRQEAHASLMDAAGDLGLDALADLTGEGPRGGASESALDSKLRPRERTLHGLMREESDDGGNDDALAMYEAAAEATHKRKRSREERRREAVDAAASTPYVEVEDKALGDGKRGASYKMLKNKGLTPSRKALIPRLKHRVRFGKASIKHRTSGRSRQAKALTGHYQGESTGIRSKVVRSVKY